MDAETPSSLQRPSKAIYVESHIDTSIETVWAHTQAPETHQRWDVRFRTIDYMPRTGDQPQRFVYATKVAPGVTVDGRGETIGERHRADGTAYSGLRFWSDHRLSLIRQGAGYWRYVPHPDGGVRFLTRYDYQVRWGTLGRLVDRFVFRPLFGWATAWSFDRLRLWIERGIAPEQSLKQTVVHAISVITLACMWLYQGLIPKLLFPDSGERELVQSAGIAGEAVSTVVVALGVIEIAFGLAMLSRWRSAWPFHTTLFAMPVLLASAAISDATVLQLPFNPAALNLAMAALAGIALLTRQDLPSGRTPLRQPVKENRS